MTGSDAITDDEDFLSDACMQALGLQHQPFTATPVGGELFEDETTRALINDINGALYGGDDVLLVLGPEGSGRSTLLRQLASNSQSRIACFSVKGTARFDTAHLFASILQAFKAPVPNDLKDALDALIPNLQGTFERYNRLSTIVLDDAEQVSVDELTKLLSSVLYLNGHEEPLIRVLLSSTANFEERLPDALPEGAEIRYASLTIEPYDTERAESYLDFRLNQAGYYEEFPFTDRATQSILETSAGYPGELNKAAAVNLNAQHDPEPESMLPPELVNQRSEGTALKYILGGLACIMIVAGLFLFARNDGERSPAARSSEGYRTVETVPITPGTGENVNELELVDEPTSATDTQLASNVATNTANLTGSTATNGTNATAPTDDASSTGAPLNSTGGSNATQTSATDSNDTKNQPTESNATSEPAQEPGDVPESDTESATAPETASEPTSTDNEDPSAADTMTTAGTNSTSPLASDSDSANSDEALLADTQPAGQTTDNTSNQANNEPASAPSAALESPTWIMVQDPQRFTVQMSASTDRASVESFLSRNQLPGPNSIFSFNRNGATWYALVYGLFNDVPEARTALKNLPEAALRNQPWIRRVGQVQDALKDQN